MSEIDTNLLHVESFLDRRKILCNSFLVMGKDLWKTIISDFQDRPLFTVKPRRVELPVNTGKLITVTGVRRSGKTYLLFEVMQRLMAGGVSKSRLLYINFEDERLDQQPWQLDDIIQAYRELYPDQDLQECYWFFDEIQGVKGWEKFLRRVQDTITKQVFVTGSNATLLSREVATALRGRSLTYELYPLNFQEYLKFTGVEVSGNSSQGRARLLRLFTQFMYTGGFPETLNIAEELIPKLLQDYFQAMLFRDLIERYGVTQTAILKYFCKRLLASSGSEFSVNKIFNDLKSQGYKVGKDTLYEFETYVEAIYLCLLVPKYADSVVRRELSSKKIYGIDVGLVGALDLKFVKDKGRQLETLVALELIKYGKRVNYYRNGWECDLVVQDGEIIKEVVQVCWDMSESETREREIKGLIQTCQKLGVKRGVVVTWDQIDHIQEGGIQIEVLPGYQYVLGLVSE